MRKNMQSKLLQWTLTLAGLVLGILFNNRGLIGLLPVLDKFGEDFSQLGPRHAHMAVELGLEKDF